MTEHSLRGRLIARPRPGPAPSRTITDGLHFPLGSGERAPVLFVPRQLPNPAPVVVLLHGAGGTARDILPILEEEAESRGFLVLLPQSEGSTWDLLQHDYGPDVETMDRALTWLFAMCPVDPDRVAIGGFSDGGSYALSLGVGNGDLFRHVLAFSPGFVGPGEPHGRPAVFISHGTEDRVLPIDRCSRRIVPALQRAGYSVDYREFNGGHVVPTEMVQAAMEGLGWNTTTS